MLSLPEKMKILLILAKTLEKKLNFSRSAFLKMKTTVSLKYFVSDCRWKSDGRFREATYCDRTDLNPRKSANLYLGVILNLKH